MSDNLDDFNPFSAKSAEKRRRENPIRSGGLGGWLILVAVFVIGLPVWRLLAILEINLPLILAGDLGRVDTPQGEVRDPEIANLVIFESVSTGFFLLAELALIVMFFRRMRMFPKFYISVCFLRIAFLVADYFLLKSLTSVEFLYWRSYFTAYAIAAGVNLVLILYLWSSERVEATFVR